MAKKNSGMAGGVLVLLGSLVYLYVLFTWYGTGTNGAWLSSAQFLTPFVAAGAFLTAITLFFMSLGSVAGMSGDAKMMSTWLWKFTTWAGLTTFIVTGGTAWFWYAVVGFVLTYLGAAWATMM